LLLRFGLNAPGAVGSSAPGLATAYPDRRHAMAGSKKAEQLRIIHPLNWGIAAPRVESASRPPPVPTFGAVGTPLHLSPEVSSHRDSFFAATPPSFTMSPIIWCAPGSQGSFTPPFPPGPFHPITAFTHLESSGPFRRSGHNDAQSNRQRGKPVRIGTAVEQPKVFHRSTVK
jgi:hypothetical protein